MTRCVQARRLHHNRWITASTDFAGPDLRDNIGTDMAIFQIDRRSIANFDVWFLVLVLVINVLGIVNLTSAAIGTGLWKTQTYWLLISIGVSVVVLFVDYQEYEKYTTTAYIFSLIALLGVHFFAQKVNGARSWYNLGFAHFQPSELVKITTILMLARYYHRDTQQNVWSLRDLAWPAFMVGLPVLMILKEPDMGTALTILLFAGTMVLFAGIKRIIIVVTAALVILSIYPAWQWVLKPHQKERIMIFLQPNRNVREEGYHAFQSKIAVGSGGWSGMGFKHGKMHMLRFLPAQQTDFVFGVWAEEWGFVWVALVIALYAWVIVKGIRAAQDAKDRFGVMLAVGCTALLFWHTFINISMVVGLFPIIGVPLPFMTYGGSNLLTFMIAVAIILNVRMRKYFF
jgi:rod shape determining protein RodA